MKIAVIGTAGKWSSQSLADEIAKEIGECPLIDMGDIELDLGEEALWADGENLCEYDAVVVKKIAQVYSPNALDRLEQLRFIEKKGVRVFSSVSGIMGLIDRLSCTVTLKAGGIPMPETFITESPEVAFEKLQIYGRAVLKPLFSTKARGMIYLDKEKDGLEVIKKFQAEGNQTIYLQRFVKGPGRDLGICFLGGEYLGTYARVGSGESWNTTTESGGHYQSDDPPPAWINIARRAQALFELDFTCVDLIETDEGPRVFEVSAFGGFRGLKEAAGVNVAEQYADYVIQQVSKRRKP